MPDGPRREVSADRGARSPVARILYARLSSLAQVKSVACRTRLLSAVQQP
jgi:hypothetical protein